MIYQISTSQRKLILDEYFDHIDISNFLNNYHEFK